MGAMIQMIEGSRQCEGKYLTALSVVGIPKKESTLSVRSVVVGENTARRVLDTV